MHKFQKAVGTFFGVLCVALLMVTCLWYHSVCSIPQEAETVAELGKVEEERIEDDILWEQQYTEEQRAGVEIEEKEEEGQKTNEVLGNSKGSEEFVVQDKKLENKIATLRMKREKNWKQWEYALEQREDTESEALLKKYQALRYKEQELEVLLQAKGISQNLVVLEEQQANILVEASKAETQYEKIYDLVERNTDYLPEAIVVIPLMI